MRWVTLAWRSQLTATGSAGRCAHEAARTTSSDVAIGLAGPLAEAMALRLDHQAAAKDYAAVAASLATLPPDRRRKILARGLWMARSILDDRWDEVRDLAGQLRRKGFIVMPRKRYVIPIQTGARR